MVVVGYGTQKKATLTGAVTVVGAKQMENKGTLSSPVQALQGQVPGVIITRGSSAPGDESWSMSLRGAVSKNAAAPLIIIDGVEYESVNELRLPNPSDIESMNFLKDAAASIYGSKAAGGVVLVTTKKAKEGKVRVDYSGSVSMKAIGLSAELMSLDQWADAVLQARTNDGYGADDTWVKYATLARQYRRATISTWLTPAILWPRRSGRRGRLHLFRHRLAESDVGHSLFHAARFGCKRRLGKVYIPPLSRLYVRRQQPQVGQQLQPARQSPAGQHFPTGQRAEAQSRSSVSTDRTRWPPLR